MNLADSFARFLETTLGITLGSDLFIGNAPSSNSSPDNIWWVAASGGAPRTRLKTGESVKSYSVDVYCRNAKGRMVYDSLHQLEETLNNDGCSQLEGFDVIDIEAIVFPVDRDLDSEDRKVGLLQASITTYKGVL